MLNRVYEKACNAGKLSDELVEDGLPKHPAAGARFYGVSSSGGQTTVHVYDDLTSGEEDTIDAAVTAHSNSTWVSVSRAFHVKTYVESVLVLEEWFAVDNGDGTYSQKAREIAYTYNTAGKLTSSVDRSFWSDGSVRSTDTTNHFTNMALGTSIGKKV